MANDVDDRLDGLVLLADAGAALELGTVVGGMSASELGTLLVYAVGRLSDESVRRAAVVEAHELIGKVLHDGDESQVKRIKMFLEGRPPSL